MENSKTELYMKINDFKQKMHDSQLRVSQAVCKYEKFHKCDNQEEAYNAMKEVTKFSLQYVRSKIQIDRWLERIARIEEKDAA
jgi:hypothetical protein